ATATTSPCLDLTRGFAAWRAGRLQHSRRVLELERKRRKLGREVGPVRFVVGDDSVVVQQVMAWKSAQARDSGARDVFGTLPWAKALVEHIASSSGAHFGGEVAALYAGDKLVAAHVGMRSRTVLHWWFPGYAAAFAAYSPGALLLLSVAENAAQRGMTSVDLG